MRARPDYLRGFLSMLLSIALLATCSSVVPFTRSPLAGVAPTSQFLKTRLIQIQPILIGYNPGPGGQVWSASPVVQPVRFACQRNINPQPSLCYGPYQVRQAYRVSDLITKQHITGKGSSITIIDAYGNPNIRKDLQIFDAAWGLPNPRLNIVAPFGVAGSDSAWISETSLDVEWAHVMAPDATINLVLARDSDDYNIYKALAYAVKRNLGDVISLSFGENEGCVDAKLRQDEHNIFEEASNKGITLLAATGDFGSAQLACDSSAFTKAISFPSDDPLVTAVGGTTLIADAITGRYIRETAWNESNAFNKATGGGYSRIYRVPAFQQNVIGKATGRAVPDISLNASVNGGVIVFESRGANVRPAINIMGGTSAAAPELAGLIADGVQIAHHRLGPLNPALYQLGTGSAYTQLMHDIVRGNNILLSTGLNGYKARTGWDAATGWGSPKDAGAWLQALIAASTPIPSFPGTSATPTPTLPTNGA